MVVYFDPTMTGYNAFRYIIHRNCYTGILHGIGILIATTAFSCYFDY